MIIINADDWGRSRADTNAALTLHKRGRISSVSAMVFMEDSSRAAELAKEYGIEVGLHLNFSEPFASQEVASSICRYQEAIVRFLKFNKYNLLLYNPFLYKEFRHVYQAQVDEFHRLFRKGPSHFDGHEHMHLCGNMLFDRNIPEGANVRRSFSFFLGEKSLLNRKYRELVNRWLEKKYCLTDYFFALSQQIHQESLVRVSYLARTAVVELMTHPVVPEESAFLASEGYLEVFDGIKLGRQGKFRFIGVGTVSGHPANLGKQK